MTKPRALSLVQLMVWPALVLALAGSIANLAWAFASVQGGNLVLGYIQAGAVDLGLIALAVGIQARRKRDNPAGWLWGGTAFFGAISLYGNLLHGYAHAQEVNAPHALSVLRPVVLAAVLPVLVLVLCEVVGHDARTSGASVAHKVEAASQLANAERTANAADAHTQTGSALVPYRICAICGYSALTQPAYAGHCRKHAQPAPDNGHERVPVAAATEA